MLVSAELTDAGFTITFTADSPGKITWPIFGGASPVKALILPSYEGAFIPTDDVDWRDFLITQSPYDTTAGLVMPFWGLQFDLTSLTYILPNPYNNELAFTKSGDTFAATLTHEFTPNQKQKTFSVIVQLTGDSPVAPAKAYRQYLIDHNQFVSLQKKIEQTPNAARLIGASQIYVWGSDLLSKYDVARLENLRRQTPVRRPGRQSNLRKALSRSPGSTERDDDRRLSIRLRQVPRRL